MILIAILLLCLLLSVTDLLRAIHRRRQRHGLAKSALIAAVLVTAACSRTVPTRGGPVPAQCNAMCEVPCTTQLPRWEPADPDSPDAWDSLAPQVIQPAQQQLQQCELHRQACTQCLQRLRAAGVLL